MNVLNTFRSQIGYSRDILNFVSLDTARPEDDIPLAQFLVKTFSEVTNKRLPEGYIMSPERQAELVVTEYRRTAGLVKILKLGKEIIGTYCLLKPQHYPESWDQNLIYFNTFAVASSFHGTQLSQVLLADAHWEVVKKEYIGIGLHVYVKSPKLSKFYEKVGFQANHAGDYQCTSGDILGYQKMVTPENTNQLLKMGEKS